MSLIDDILAAAIAETGDVSALLRKCKLLAARLDHAEFAQWVDHELRGYPEDGSLPSYRLVNVFSYGQFIGSFGARADRLQIPVGALPEHLRDRYRVARLSQSISGYEQLLQGEPGGSAQMPWPVSLALKYASKITPDMQCVAAWMEIPLGAIHVMINEVKTTILGFAIDIQREAPEAGESPVGGPRPIPEERVTQIFHTHIAGNVGNVANGGSDFQQSANVTVQTGDWAALERYLRSLGMPDDETRLMKAELDAVKGGEQEPARAKAREWIGRVLGRATTAATGVAVDVAAAGIAKAIAGYLGFPIS